MSKHELQFLDKYNLAVELPGEARSRGKNKQTPPYLLKGVGVRDELIVSRNYRMPIYRTFQHIEKNIVSNLQYRVSRYWFILCFSAENSPKIPKILRKFRKSSENSENSPKIQKILRKFRKFSENSENSPKIPQKEGLFWGPNIVSISYHIEKKP